MSTILRPPIINFDSKRTEIKNDIDQIYADYQRQEQIEQQSMIHRNILLLGPSKSGKTTLKHILIDPRHVAEELSLRSVSDTLPTYEQHVVSSVTLNIIELPGRMIHTQSDLSIINTECNRFGIQDFHLICFCLSFDTGIDGNALKLCVRLINYLGEQFCANLCLIITRCETKNDIQREKLKKELMQDIDFRKIMQYFQRGIHFSGALNHDDWNRASEGLYNQFETIYFYRRNLLNLIQTNMKPFHVPILQAQIQRPSTSSSRVIQTDSKSSSVQSQISLPVKPSFQTSQQHPVSSQSTDTSEPNVATAILPKTKRRKFSKWFRLGRAMK